MARTKNAVLTPEQKELMEKELTTGCSSSCSYNLKVFKDRESVRSHQHQRSMATAKWTFKIIRFHSTQMYYNLDYHCIFHTDRHVCFRGVKIAYSLTVDYTNS